MTPVIAVLALLGLTGGVPVGRWLRRVTYRKPDEEEMDLPGSRWWVAPVLCGSFAAISWRVLAAPAATGHGAGTDPGGGSDGPSATQVIVLLTLLLVALAGVCLAAMDLDVHRLPDRVMWPTMALLVSGLGLAAALGGEWGAFGRALLAGFGCGTAYLTLALGSLARGSLALGMGDVKLAVVLGAALGWFGLVAVVVGMYAGFLAGGALALLLVLTRRIGLRGDLAFGPPMMVGALIGLLTSPDILSWVF